MLDEKKYIDETRIIEENFEDSKDVFKYLYKFKKEEKEDNLVLAYLHAEPKKKKFVRNQRKLINLVVDFLQKAERSIDNYYFAENIVYNEKKLRVE
jgi:hypothetical protein